MDPGSTGEVLTALLPHTIMPLLMTEQWQSKIRSQAYLNCQPTIGSTSIERISKGSTIGSSLTPHSRVTDCAAETERCCASYVAHFGNFEPPVCFKSASSPLLPGFYCHCQFQDYTRQHGFPEPSAIDSVCVRYRI